jgi:hypothetical protein
MSDQLVAKVATYARHNKHKRRKSKLSAGFESTIPITERPQTFAVNRTVKLIGHGVVSEA